MGADERSNAMRAVTTEEIERIALARLRGVPEWQVDMPPQLIPVSRGGAVQWGPVEPPTCDMTGCSRKVKHRGLCLEHWRTQQHRHTD